MLRSNMLIEKKKYIMIGICALYVLSLERNMINLPMKNGDSQ
jgi:uncharacterized membrane protein YuzA (DUF378 family)